MKTKTKNIINMIHAAIPLGFFFAGFYFLVRRDVQMATFCWVAHLVFYHSFKDCMEAQRREAETQGRKGDIIEQILSNALNGKE